MAKNKSVRSVQDTVDKIAKPYVKAFAGRLTPIKGWLRGGRKGTTLRKAVANRIRLEKSAGLLQRRDHYRGNKYVHGRYQIRY